MRYLYILIGTYETKRRFQFKPKYCSETLTGLLAIQRLFYRIIPIIRMIQANLVFETRKVMKFNHCYTALNMCSITTDN